MDEKVNCIFVNGKIFTSNPKQPYANTMVVNNGRIEWIGDEKNLQTINGDYVDLKGRRVLPGLIDAHMHPLFLANASNQIPCTPPIVNSIEDLLYEIKKRRDKGVDAWIEGWGYDEGKLIEGRAPTRWDLDKASSDVPVVITRTCYHIISVNSMALKLAGIDKNTSDPPGGQIDRDSNGEPTGILRENAKNLIYNIMPTQTLEDTSDVLASLSPKLFAHGITAIAESLARTEPIEYFDIYNKAYEKGLKQRVVLYYNWEDLKKQSYFDKNRTYAENHIRIGGIKIIADGSVSGRTAWVNPSYLGDDEDYGLKTTSKEELLVAAEFASRNNLQLVIHAMGEQSIDLIVDTFCRKKGWLEDIPSVRVEHGAMPTEKAVKGAVKSGIAFVTQPIFLYAEIESYLKNLGTDRTKKTYPIKNLLDARVRVAFSSDAPATAWADPSNPFVGIKSAVTRVAYDGTDTGQEQRLDIPTAIMLYTREAQRVIGIPYIGQLSQNYYADFIVLDKDILSISPDKIDEICVERVYMGGQLVYEK